MRHLIELNNLHCTHGIMQYYVTGVCSVISEGENFKLEGVNLSHVKVEFGYNPYNDLTSDFGGYYLQPNQIDNLEKRLMDYPQFIWFIKGKIKEKQS